MDFCEQLKALVKLLNAETVEASSQGYSTVTLTHDEVAKITQALSQANQQIVHRPNH
jgi:arsenate reductase-like glutaredoxin family protein